MVDKFIITIKRAARKFLDKKGLIILNKSRFDSARFALAKAVEVISSTQKHAYEPGIEGVVFSKDRPLQLHALLNSYFAMCHDDLQLTVIYNASSSQFEESYSQVENIFRRKKIRFVRENKFRSTLIDCISNVKTERIFFLVDDIIFVRPVVFGDILKVSMENSVPSLRLAPHLNYCYTSAANQCIPKLTELKNTQAAEKIFYWSWGEGEYDWSYPLSVDGNILKTQNIAIICQLMDYFAPNSFEVALQWFNYLYIDSKGICYEKSRLVNIPFNKVQSENANLSGDVSAEDMLRYWLDGYEVDIDRYADLVNISAHQEMKLYLRKRL